MKRRWYGKLAAGLAASLMLAACASQGEGGGEVAATNESDSEQAAPAEASASDEMGSSETGGETEEVSIAFVTGVLANPYVQATLDEMEEVAAEASVELTVIDANFDAQKQFSDLQDAIASEQYDGIILLPLDGNALAPLVEEAVGAGIAVGNTDLPLGPDNTTTEIQVPGLAVSVLRPFSQHGENMGELAVEACEGDDDCQVAFVYGSKALPADQTISQYFSGVLSGHDNIRLVAEGEGGYSRDGGLAAAQDILQAHPDLDVWVSVDQSALGAETAIADAGLIDQIQVIGYGGTQQAVDAIRAGRWFGNSASVPRTEGRLVLEGLLRKIREGTDVGGLDGVVEADVPDNGKLTADNIDEFEPEYEG